MNRVAAPFLVLLALTACGTSAPTVVYRDSVRTEYRDRLIRDTAYIEILKEVEHVVTRDTSSRLENTYALSEAAIADGLLYHSLETKPQSIPVPVTVTVRDTVVVEKAATETIKEVEVEKPLTWWQRLRIGAFWWLLAACAFGYRRELAKLIKLLA